MIYTRQQNIPTIFCTVLLKESCKLIAKQVHSLTLSRLHQTHINTPTPFLHIKLSPSPLQDSGPPLLISSLILCSLFIRVYLYVNSMGRLTFWPKNEEFWGNFSWASSVEKSFIFKANYIFRKHMFAVIDGGKFSVHIWTFSGHNRESKLTKFYGKKIEFHK